MDRSAQSEILQRMLADAQRLAEAGDPLLTGLYGSLAARIAMMISVLDEQSETVRGTSQPQA
jgi:hypothetical protein